MSIPKPSSTSSAATVPVLLIIALCLQTTVPPFATDTYTPAIPQVTEQLAPTAPALVGLTLTAFFVGMGLGSLLGGPLSDRHGRRGLLALGGLLCLLGAVGCAVAPSIEILVAARVVQGIGGGVAAVVARAVVVDVATGDQLPKVLSLMMAIGGLAPMVAPVIGGVVISLGGGWRTVFWILAGLAALMVTATMVVIGESLPPDRRSAGGLRSFAASLGELAGNRVFIGYLLLNACSGFAMMAYVSNSSYVLQEIKGLPPLAFSFLFAANALALVLVSIVNSRLVGRFAPEQLITVGLSLSALAALILVTGVVALGTPLVLTCVGFFILMSSQGLIFGNSGALASAAARHVAGAASALLGVAMSVAASISAPIATSGGGRTALPMVLVMLFGVGAAWCCFLLVARGRRPVAA